MPGLPLDGSTMTAVVTWEWAPGDSFDITNVNKHWYLNYQIFR